MIFWIGRADIDIDVDQDRGWFSGDTGPSHAVAKEKGGCESEEGNEAQGSFEEENARESNEPIIQLFRGWTPGT